MVSVRIKATGKKMVVPARRRQRQCGDAVREETRLAASEEDGREETSWGG